MLVRTAKRAFAPRNLVATSILGLTLAGVVYAAAANNGAIANNSVTGIDIKNNSIASADIQNNSITEADIKNGSLRGRDFVNNSVGGNQVDESTLGKVPSASTADTATSATNATNATNATTSATATLADKAKGFTRISSGFTAAATFPDYATGEANAAFITLFETGSLKLQAKCFHRSDANVVDAVVYATTTKDGAVFESQFNSLRGAGVVNNTTFLYTDSSLTNRYAFGASASINELDYRGEYRNEFSLLGIDGSWMGGALSMVVRNGTPTGAPTTFYGSDRSCAFFGSVAHSGNA